MQIQQVEIASGHADGRIRLSSCRATQSKVKSLGITAAVPACWLVFVLRGGGQVRNGRTCSVDRSEVSLSASGPGFQTNAKSPRNFPHCPAWRNTRSVGLFLDQTLLTHEETTYLSSGTVVYAFAVDRLRPAKRSGQVRPAIVLQSITVMLDTARVYMYCTCAFQGPKLRVCLLDTPLG